MAVLNQGWRYLLMMFNGPIIRVVAAVCAVLVLAPAARAGEATQPAYGWRGNLTGLFPQAQVPAEWSNVSTGPAEGLKCTTTQPAGGGDKDAAAVTKGLVNQWLVVGPFTVQDATKEFDAELIGDEAKAAPRIGDKVGELAWRYAQPTSDIVSFYNVNVTPTPGKGQRNQVGYATTCLYAAKGGRLRAVMEHVVGVKVYVNGKEVYRDKEQRMVVGSAYGLSRNRVASAHPIAPSFDFDVAAGWNRMTIKLVAPNRSQWNDLAFYLRLADVADAKYDRKNILWMTALPDRSNGTPIVVGGKVFVMAEPDELICIDGATGKILWNATNTYYDATPQAARDANSAFKEKVEPLAQQVKAEADTAKRAGLRKKLQDALLAVDKKKYAQNLDGHLAGHFEIVGFTTTPCSDGKYVYIWTGAGVAACYDLDGKRQWIRRFEEKLFYSAAPALIGGRLAVFFRQLYGLDARTGEILWQQPEVNKTVASLLSARLAGTDVFISQQAEIIRASDGRMLWKNPAKIVNDTGWAAGVVIGDVIYQPWYGITQVFAIDCSACTGDDWKPKVRTIGDIAAGLPRMAGDQGDRWTASSPLVLDGLLYDIDIHSTYYVVDLKTGKALARKDLGFKQTGEFNYVALTVAASPTLVGNFIVVMDNQGNSVTLEPGPECKIIARNRLATQLQRDWPITTQEFISYSPPVADGKRMYLRGERYLYCIGQ
jgi:outer membrane protein assembly factor BamB